MIPGKILFLSLIWAGSPLYAFTHDTPWIITIFKEPIGLAVAICTLISLVVTGIVWVHCKLDAHNLRASKEVQSALAEALRQDDCICKLVSACLRNSSDVKKALVDALILTISDPENRIKLRNLFEDQKSGIKLDIKEVITLLDVLKTPLKNSQ